MAQIRKRFDFMLAGNGYMLARDPDSKGRAWNRSGVSDAVSKQTHAEGKFSNLPDEIDFAEVWDDWSGGCGYPYRKEDNPNTYHLAQDLDARVPGQVILCQQLMMAPGASTNINVERLIDIPIVGTTTPPVGAGSVLAIGKGFIAAYTPSTTTGSSFDRDIISGNPLPMGRPAIFGSHIYIGMGTSSPFMQVALSDFSTSLGPGLTADGFVVAGGKLWRHFNKYCLSSVAAGASPMATPNWSATLYIGNQQMGINDITQLQDQLFVGLPDGLYAGDESGSFFNVLPGPASSQNPDNGRDLDVDSGTIYAPYADDLLYLKPNVLNAESGHIGPVGMIRPTWNTSQGLRLTTKSLRSVKSYGPWLYAGGWTGSQSVLFAGRPIQQGMIWHTQQVLNKAGNVVSQKPTRINRIHFDSITTTSGGVQIPVRCWLATDASGFTGTAPLYYFSIPRLHGDPTAIEHTFSPNYCQNGTMELGAVDRNLPGTQKIFRSVEIWGDNLSSFNYISVTYDVDKTGSWQAVGLGDTYKYSPSDAGKQIMYFPAGEGSFVTGQSIVLRIALTSLSQNETPTLRSVVLRGVVRPRSVGVITAMVRVSDNMRDRHGQPMRSAAVTMSSLRELAGTDAPGTEPHQLIDLSGATSWVTVIPPIEEREVYQQGEEYPELVATVKMSVQDYTSNFWTP